jgi:tetratricopeptide (TPR) repeat protein
MKTLLIIPLMVAGIEVARPPVFDGLYSYEKVLIVCGVVLFVVLVGLLIFLVIKKREYKWLLPALVFPIVMIGFPAIQKFQFDAEAASLETKESAVREKPNDVQARAALETTAANVAKRSSEDPQIQIRLARAFDALDKPEQAMTHVNQALRIQPNRPEAVMLRAQLQNLVRRVPPPPPRP